MRRTLFGIALLGIMLGQFAGPRPVVQAASKWGPATLGGTFADWKHAYGAPMKLTNLSPDEYDWFPCGNHKWGEAQVIFDHGRAISIISQGCGSDALSPMSLRLSLLHRFIPSDAVAHGAITIDDGTGLKVKVQLYTSVQLAHMLPRGAFTDCNGNAVTPGKLAVDLHDSDDSDLVMVPGTCAIG